MTEAGAATGRKPSTTFTFFSAALKLSMSCCSSACPVYLIGATATVSVTVSTWSLGVELRVELGEALAVGAAGERIAGRRR